MTNKRKRRLIMGLIFALAFFLLIYQVASRNNFSSSQRGKNIGVEKTAEMIDEERAQKGWNRMIGGVLIFVDAENGKIEIERDPLGERKKYEVNLNKKTEILQLEFEEVTEQKKQQENDVERLEQEYREIFSERSLSDLLVGMNVEISFPERVDLNVAKRLNAEKIIILPNQE